MLAFDQREARFHYKVAGVALNRDRVLLSRMPPDEHWALPGGRAEILETSQQALVREMREELGVSVRVGRLLWVVENFFDYGGLCNREVGLYFLMNLPGGGSLHDRGDVFEMEDERGMTLVFRWQPVASLGQVTLLPSFLQKALPAIPDVPVHIVHDDARGGATA